MVLQVRCVLECNEGNSGLKGGSEELCSKGGLLGVHKKCHNVPHWLRMGRHPNIQLV